MKKFANVQDALEFAAANRVVLKFPFICRCNGFTLKVLSPDLARTTERDRPTLVVTRNNSGVLELGYVISMQSLKELLYSISGPDSRYEVVCSKEEVKVYRDQLSAGTQEFTFPLARRNSDFADQVGDYVLLLSRPQAKDWHRFWLPIETRLLHSSISSVA